MRRPPGTVAPATGAYPFRSATRWPSGASSPAQQGRPVRAEGGHPGRHRVDGCARPRRRGDTGRHVPGAEAVLDPLSSGTEERLEHGRQLECAALPDLGHGCVLVPPQHAVEPISDPEGGDGDDGNQREAKLVDEDPTAVAEVARAARDRGGGDSADRAASPDRANRIRTLPGSDPTEPCPLQSILVLDGCGDGHGTCSLSGVRVGVGRGGDGRRCGRRGGTPVAAIDQSV